MKALYLLLSVVIVTFLLSAAVFLRGSGNISSHNTSFTISVTPTAMVTKIIYDPEQSPQVQKYMDSCLQPELVFGGRHKINKEVQLSSGQLQYHIKASPGMLKITADKKSNTDSSLNKLKNIFEGLKSILNQPARSNI